MCNAFVSPSISTQLQEGDRYTIAEEAKLESE